MKKKVAFAVIAIVLFLGAVLFWYQWKESSTSNREPAIFFNEQDIEAAVNKPADTASPSPVKWDDQTIKSAADKPMPQGGIPYDFYKQPKEK